MIITRSARFSRCGAYRYELLRSWDAGLGCCVFIGLNPSTADAEVDDPTIRRCMGFARDWGFQQLKVVNLFAYRTPYPRELVSCADPAGSANRRAIRRACHGADKVIAAWGAHGSLHDQALKLADTWADLSLECLGLTRTGQPVHPLYQRRDATLQPFRIDRHFQLHL